MPAERSVYVWDLPTRIFHWSLLALILIAWFTGEEEGAGALIHLYAGEAVAGLIVFRVVWGFIGGERARFADFAAGPAAVFAHVRNLFSRQPARHLGHNPLGAVAVFLLLIVIAAVVVTGLFSESEAQSGPFAGLWGLELSELHEELFRTLQGLVVLHLLGVAVETVKTKDALVRAMITGKKRRRTNEPGGDARRASFAALLIAGLAGLVMTGLLISASASAGCDIRNRNYEDAYHEDRDERGRDH
jgi:cytochrome b